MLTDAKFIFEGMIKSNYLVLFYKKSICKKFAVKLFPRGMKQAEEDFNHESGMHFEALKKKNVPDSFIVLAVEWG